MAAASLALLVACEAREQTDATPVAEEQAEVALLSTPPRSPAEIAARTGGVSCRPEELALFACTLGNGKRMAVCGQGEWTAVYRYGADTPELELVGGELGHAMYSGGGESQIAFTNGDVRYIVFSRLVRTNFTAGEPNNPAISDGVVVVRGDTFVDIQLCDDPSLLPVNLNAAGAIFEIGDLFTGETIRADP